MIKMNRRYRTILLPVTFCFLFAAMVMASPERKSNTISAPIEKPVIDNVSSKLLMYDSLQLNNLGLSRAAFEKAVKGYNYLLSLGKIQNENIISIIDFSLSSDKKRLFVIDLKEGELLFHTFVAHGKNSGLKTATKFSNKVESKKSSLGFYITGETYNGSHGYSLRLQGLEKGINDNVLRRGIVMHSAAYVDEDYVTGQGFIGRSLGCPAIPATVYKEVIETIKSGTCLFMYSPDKFYATHSAIIKQTKG
jgi:hypothetical protein